MLGSQESLTEKTLLTITSFLYSNGHTLLDLHTSTGCYHRNMGQGEKGTLEFHLEVEMTGKPGKYFPHKKKYIQFFLGKFIQFFHVEF